MGKLSKRTVAQATPRDSDDFICDDELPGFGLRVFTSGRRSYVVQHRAKGRTRRFTIGVHGVWTPETARREARVLLGRIAQGDNPAEQRALADTATPIQALALPDLGGDARRHFAALIEPAAQRLGELWMADALSEIELTIALGRLQWLVRQRGRRSSQASPRANAPAVLVTPMPGEQHALGAVLASAC